MGTSIVSITHKRKHINCFYSRYRYAIIPAMRFIRTEVWGYAILLVTLFCICTIAVWHTLAFIHESVPSHDEFTIITILVWAITLGFMFIAGAFGLWAIEFSAVAEGQRRISRMVNSMDYIQDGLIACNSKGLITGSNLAARKIVRIDADSHISQIFPSLSEKDIIKLITSEDQYELEKEVQIGHLLRILRFRSQPAEGISLIMISDVTNANTERLRARQTARLQLIGQISRGVANEFNSVLCAISGYASLFKRLPRDSSEVNSAIDAIIKNADRGVAISEQLLQLAKPVSSGSSAEYLPAHIEKAIEILNETLPVGWKISSTIDHDIPVIGTSGIQIEQHIINTCIMACDIIPKAGFITISARKTGSCALAQVNGEYACIVLISITQEATDMDSLNWKDVPAGADPRVVFSVLKSLIDEAGGDMDERRCNGSVLYRIMLPQGRLRDIKTDRQAIAEEVSAYIKGWHVLLVAPQKEQTALDNRLKTIGVQSQYIDNLMTALPKIESDKDLHAIIIDKRILGSQSSALLRAILKLRPESGLIVITDANESADEAFVNQVVFVEQNAQPDRIINQLVDARTMAAQRKT